MRYALATDTIADGKFKDDEIAVVISHQLDWDSFSRFFVHLLT